METTSPPQQILEKHRFRPSQETIIAMKTFRAKLPEIQKTHPEAEGFGFYGSKSLGLDAKSSDWDMVAFIDLSKNSNPTENNDLSSKLLLQEKEKPLIDTLEKIYTEEQQKLSLPSGLKLNKRDS